MISAFTAVKDAMLPLGHMLNTILPGRKRLGVFHEDNTAMICICKSGRNPTMRHIGRTHRIAVSWLHEVLGKETDQIGPDDIETWYTNSDRMRADIYTKAFTDSIKWDHATKMIGMAAMTQIEPIVKFMSENFKTEQDQPKEPKTKSDDDPEASQQADPSSKPGKPKGQTQNKPKQVAAPARSRTNHRDARSTSSCLLLSAIISCLAGQGKGQQANIGVSSCAIAPLPYNLTGGGLLLTSCIP